MARARDTDATVTLEVAGVAQSVVLPAGRQELTVSVQLANVDRWWPAGHGAQPLYDARVALSVGDVVLDDTVRRVGFRTLRWNSAARRDRHAVPAGRERPPDLRQGGQLDS